MNKKYLSFQYGDRNQPLQHVTYEFKKILGNYLHEIGNMFDNTVSL